MSNKTMSDTEEKRGLGPKPLAPVLGVDDAAHLAGVSKNAVLQALKAGEMAGRNLGGSVGWRTTEEAVLAWVRTGNTSAED